MLLLMELVLCAKFSFKFGDNIVSIIIIVVVVDIINTSVLTSTIDVNIFGWQHGHCLRRHHGYCCHVNQRNQLTSSQSLSSSSLHLARAYGQSANAKSTIYLCRIDQNLKKKERKKAYKLWSTFYRRPCNQPYKYTCRIRLYYGSRR